MTPPPFWNFSENSSDLLTLHVPKLKQEIKVKRTKKTFKDKKSRNLSETGKEYIPEFLRAPSQIESLPARTLSTSNPRSYSSSHHAESSQPVSLNQVVLGLIESLPNHLMRAPHSKLPPLNNSPNLSP